MALAAPITHATEWVLFTRTAMSQMIAIFINVFISYILIIDAHLIYCRGMG